MRYEIKSLYTYVYILTKNYLYPLQNLSQIEPNLIIGNGCEASKAPASSTTTVHGDHPKSSSGSLEVSSSKVSLEYRKLRKLLNYEEAPKYLQFNSFIKSGYRNILPTRMCIESIFWWTNETVNIWSHIIGWFLFFSLGCADYVFLRNYGSTQDKVVAAILIVCFQVCMVMSSIYHTFSCRSEKDYDCFLAFDLFGIALSLIAIYISGIYYAFWCQDVSSNTLCKMHLSIMRNPFQALRNFYICTVGLIFVVCLVLQIPRLNVPTHIKTLTFVLWAAYGIIPTLHWAIVMGGFENAMVRVSSWLPLRTRPLHLKQQAIYSG